MEVTGDQEKQRGCLGAEISSNSSVIKFSYLNHREFTCKTTYKRKHSTVYKLCIHTVKKQMHGVLYGYGNMLKNCVPLVLLSMRIRL